MEVEVKNHHGRVYLPTKLRKVLNSKDLKGYASYKTVVLFSKKATLTQVRYGLRAMLSEVNKDICLEEEKHDKNTGRY